MEITLCRFFLRLKKKGITASPIIESEIRLFTDLKPMAALNPRYVPGVGEGGGGISFFVSEAKCKAFHVKNSFCLHKNVN